jgi:hypothetical protein
MADVMKIVEDSQPRKCPAMEIGINNSRLEIIVCVFSIWILKGSQPSIIACDRMKKGGGVVGKASY